MSDQTDYPGDLSGIEIFLTDITSICRKLTVYLFSNMHTFFDDEISIIIEALFCFFLQIFNFVEKIRQNFYDFK